MICVVGRNPSEDLAAAIVDPADSELAEHFFWELGLVLEAARWTVSAPSEANLPNTPPKLRCVKRYTAEQAACLGFDKIVVLGDTTEALQVLQRAIDAVAEHYLAFEKAPPKPTDDPSLN